MLRSPRGSEAFPWHPDVGCAHDARAAGCFPPWPASPSVALGLGAAELAAALVAPTASPVLVIGSLLIDLAPSWAKETAIALFGTGDKAALLDRHRARAARDRRGRRGRAAVAAPADRPAPDRGRRRSSASSPRSPGRAPRSSMPSRRPSRRSSRWSRSASCCARCPRPAASGTRRRHRPQARAAAARPARRRALPRLGRRCRRARRARRASAAPCSSPVPAPRPPSATRSPSRGPPSRRRRSPRRRARHPRPRDRHHPERASSTASTPRCRSRGSTRPPGRCAITGEVEKRDRAHLGRAASPSRSRRAYTTLMCVSNEVGGDLIGNALWLGLPDPRAAERGEAEGRGRHGALAQHRRLHRRHAADRCCRRTTATRSSRSG